MRNTILLLLMLVSSDLMAQKYVPDDPELYRTIVRLDSIFFDAYNNCTTKLQIYSDFYSEDLEFYHDKGGVMRSKKDVVDGTHKNICGKVTRNLKKGSIEVYPIKDYGAIEMGMHQFHNNAEPEAVRHDSKFIIFWRSLNGKWKIDKVVSLH